MQGRGPRLVTLNPHAGVIEWLPCAPYTPAESAPVACHVHRGTLADKRSAETLLETHTFASLHDCDVWLYTQSNSREA